MGSIWVSARDCSKQELSLLADLVKNNKSLKMIISFDLPPTPGQNESMESIIDHMLSRMGISSGLKGWQYLRTAIRLGVEDNEMLEGVTKRLYPTVAELHGSSPEKVEHSIRHAVEVAWKKGNEDALKSIFGYYTKESKKPVNSEFICSFVHYVERKMAVH